jgi:hypothetical protein
MRRDAALDNRVPVAMLAYLRVLGRELAQGSAACFSPLG